MTVDFTPIQKREAKIMAWAAPFSLDDIRAAANHGIDFMLNILDGLMDTDVTFLPEDPEANDPYAPAELQNIGWSIGHLVLHVTASTEEYTSTAAVVARGINYPREPRLRYEADWQVACQTVEECRQRILESKRMRNAALDSFPDQPNPDSRWERSEKFIEIFGELDAKGAYLMGLSHEYGHHAQFLEVKRQALAARQPA